MSLGQKSKLGDSQGRSLYSPSLTPAALGFLSLGPVGWKGAAGPLRGAVQTSRRLAVAAVWGPVWVSPGSPASSLF